MKLTLFFFVFFICGFSYPTISKPKTKNIGIVTRSNYRGETAFAYRLKKAAQNIEWKADIFDIKINNNLRHVKYDFVINLVPEFYIRPRCKNYLAIFHPKHNFFKKSGLLRRAYANYDGYLLTYQPSKADINFTDGTKPYIPWYPSVQKVDYKTVDPKHLFHLCSVWGDRFEEAKYLNFFSLLDKQPFMRFYGKPLFKERYPQSFQSMIPFDETSIFEIAAQEGVTLVIHSQDHNDYGLPSGRIFEAAASSTVIISDENSFVKDHFKDSVLYIKQKMSAESMAEQIVKHMDWIYSNPEQALAMAKEAYWIQKEKFSLENQLLNLSKFHDERSKIHAWTFVKTMTRFLQTFPDRLSRKIDNKA